MDYAKAGVDIEKGDFFANGLKEKVVKTFTSHHERIISHVGGFASLYKMKGDKVLAAGTDGVGTKCKLANILGIYNTIGIDLVAMCANDILCTGAKPLFFLDYMASNKLELDKANDLIDGIVDGCLQADCALLGGETAEMPGVYHGNEFDLAGFCVGEVEEKEIIDGSKIEEGQELIGIASSGFHSNGYSLIRKLIEPAEEELYRQALTPTFIYSQAILEILKNSKGLICGLSHITGSGLLNIPRMNPQFGYQVDFMPAYNEIPPIIEIVARRSLLTDKQLYKTFNMGVGMVAATGNATKLINMLEDKNLKCWKLGKVSKSFQGIKVDGLLLT